MKKKFFIHIPVIFIAVVFLNCGGNPSSNNQDQSEKDAADMISSDNKVSLSEVVSPQFPEAVLEMNEPLDGMNYDQGKINFQFNVKNYQLTNQTLDADTKQCANSGKGQHIHFILNGDPYKALYEPVYEAELSTGNYVVLSFLSRSYHESLKHYGAYVLSQFSVGEADAEQVDLTAPHMFYSRPKGEYKGLDTERVILDFYLVNTDLSPTGNKVRAIINGEQFLIDKWAPYFLEGLPMGESTIKLELVDSNGNVIDGPFNTVERTISLVSGNAI